MRRSRLTIWIIAALAAAILVWRVVVYLPLPTFNKSRTAVTTETSEVQKPKDANQPQLQKKLNEPNKLTEKSIEANQQAKPADALKPADAPKPVDAAAVKPAEPNDPNMTPEAMNLNNVEMKDIIQKLAAWTGKVIIPDDEALKQRLTIYAADKLPRKQALSLIYSALRTKGIIAEESEDTIYLKPVKKAILGSVPIVPQDTPLAGIENKSQIVQKFFKLKNYSPTQMSGVILPLMSEYGYITADENVRSLLIIDSVENLIRFEKLIAQMDVPEAEPTVTEIFTLRNGDPSEIVQILRILLAGSQDSSTKSGGAGGATAQLLVVGSSKTPIVLIPEMKRNGIIAKASSEDIKKIKEWIDKLDQKEPMTSEYETIAISYADVGEVANRLNDALQKMPGTELKTNVLVQPLVQARQIMIFGRPELREMVKKLIQEIDVPSGQFETMVFELKHVDPEQMKKNIDDLYGEKKADGMASYFSYRYGGQQQTNPADIVRVIAFPTIQQVTVIASPSNMRKIEKQVEEWDIPIDVNKVKPRIVELRNSDPVKMAELLTTLFSDEGNPGRMPIWFYFDGGRDEQKRKIVGALYGQLTFEAVPGTKKIIVISKIPEAYDVVTNLIAELDKQEMGEVPNVIVLNYADPEELSERLNAMFNEPGTIAKIQRGARGLSQTGMQEQADDNKTNSYSNPAPNNSSTASSANEYTPSWDSGQRRTDEMPISNVIGRVRFIPDPRSKSILVLSPPEFMESITKMIKELDQPGKQVRIKAVVVEVDHSNLTSLGIQLASNPAAFGELGENSVTAATNLNYLETHGQLTLETDSQVTAMVDLLIKKINAKILNQQTLWTKDNQEANFFKGQTVAFIQDRQSSSEGTSVTQTFDYQRVGMTLRARPNITPQNFVDMNIDLTISQLTSELVNGQPVRTYMNTTTTAIVENSQTIMLGGILFQEDSLVERKLPLLGDIPLVGGVFRHNETNKSNKELIVFITPSVIGDPNAMATETTEAKETENDLRSQFKAVSDVNN